MLRYGNTQFYLQTSHTCLYSPATEHHRPSASTHFTIPRRVEGWVDLGGWLHAEIVSPGSRSNPDTVTHPSTNRARCRLTSLIKSNSLPLRQATTPPSKKMIWMRSRRTSMPNIRGQFVQNLLSGRRHKHTPDPLLYLDPWSGWAKAFCSINLILPLTKAVVPRWNKLILNNFRVARNHVWNETKLFSG